MKKTNFVDLDNARLDEQREVMRQILTDGGCPFCEKNLKKYHKNPIIREGDYWIVTKNQWPYKNTLVHLLIIYKLHAEQLSDLPPVAFLELHRWLVWIQDYYDITGGGICMRFGDTNFSAGTIKHLHVQFIVPNLESPTYQPVRFKIGKSPKNKPPS